MQTIRYKIIPEFQLLAVHQALVTRSRHSLYPSAIEAYEDAWNVMAATLGILDVESDAIVWASARNPPNPDVLKHGHE